MAKEKTQLDTMIEVAQLAAYVLLKYGAETYRAEDTVLRMCQVFGYKTNVFALPTGLMITLESETEGTRTVVSRVESRAVDLDRIHQVNDLSRRLAGGLITPDFVLQELKNLAPVPPAKVLLHALFGALSAAFFALLFKGSFIEFTMAFFCSFVVQLVVGFLPPESGVPITNLLGGMIASAVTALLVRGCGAGNETVIVVSALMPMVPGLAMTNGIRDAMSGDLVSGVARIGEAILRAVLLAAGAGISIKLLMLLGGI